MENNPTAKLLLIFIGESDKVGQQPLYETIVFEARKQELSGARTKGPSSDEYAHLISSVLNLFLSLKELHPMTNPDQKIS